MANIQPITSTTHAAIKIKNNPHLLQSKNSHMTPVIIHEFATAAQEFPVVFIKDPDTGQFRAIALLGLNPNQNLFIKNGEWQAQYIPEALTIYPFVLSNDTNNNDSLLLCLDADSSLVNEQEGAALFDEKGQQMPWLAEKGEQLVSLVEKNQLTEMFIKALTDNDLLKPQTLTIQTPQGKDYSLNGLYVIDQQQLDQLDDPSYSVLRQRGFIAPIYASLMSMQRVKFLAAMQE
ncbi:MAG: SapC family protein [Gammaproteobacteria bacterium]|nr:SapC family protein [Gammaproteobacteria bacterium]